MEVLRLCRTNIGMPQVELAVEMGVNQQTIARWEGGHTEPCIAQLIILADFFSITVDELVRDTVSAGLIGTLVHMRVERIMNDFPHG